MREQLQTAAKRSRRDGFLQHDKGARGKDDAARVERRIESNLFGLNASRTHDVLAQSLALAG